MPAAGVPPPAGLLWRPRNLPPTPAASSLRGSIEWERIQITSLGPPRAERRGAGCIRAARVLYRRSSRHRFDIGMKLIQRLLLWLGAIISPLPAIADPGAEFAGLQNDVVFSDYSVLSSSAELLHRLVSPLNAVRADRRLAHSAVA